MGDDIEWLDLPGRWTYGVCGDGRIFFIEYGAGWAPGGLHGVGGSVWRSLLLSHGTATSPVLAFLPSWGHLLSSLKPSRLAGEFPVVPRALPGGGEGSQSPLGGADSPSVLVPRSDDTKSTSWVHPGTGYSIQSGHFSCAGEARARLLGGQGWEMWSEILRECTGDPPQNRARRAGGLYEVMLSLPRAAFPAFPGGFFPSSCGL